MVDLKVSREKIDAIDRQILKLFEERMQVSLDVAEYKKNTGKAVFDPARENEKLDVLEQMTKDSFNRQGVRELFRQVMSLSRKLQYTTLNFDIAKDFTVLDALPKTADTKVAFFGARGSYTEQAMEECFGTEITSFPASTFQEVMQAVADSKADYGVLPIENTTTGGINDSYDLLTAYDNYIVGEYVIKIEQALLALPGSSLSDIKTVYSHAQGILQSRSFLEKLGNITTIEQGSTASCAKKVKEDKNLTQAAIASVRAAKTYGLSVLKECINDEDTNSTRFLIISGKKEYIKNADTLSISFALPHESGSLYQMLSHIMFNQLNMTRIESRPILGHPFEYRFIVDFEGNLKMPGVLNALSGIQAEAKELKLLGNYYKIK